MDHQMIKREAVARKLLEERRQKHRHHGADEPFVHPFDLATTYKNLYVTKLPAGYTDADLLAAFAAHGPEGATVMRDGRTGHSKGFGFVTFGDEAAGRWAHAAFVRGPRPFDVFPSRHAAEPAPAADRCASLYVRNAPLSVPRAQLEGLLRGFGAVTRLATKADGAGVGVWLCFVTYARVADADRALAALHNAFRFPGATLPLVVKYDIYRARRGAAGDVDDDEVLQHSGLDDGAAPVADDALVSAVATATASDSGSEADPGPAAPRRVPSAVPMQLPPMIPLETKLHRPAPDSGVWYRSSPYTGGYEHIPRSTNTSMGHGISRSASAELPDSSSAHVELEGPSERKECGDHSE